MAKSAHLCLLLKIKVSSWFTAIIYNGIPAITIWYCNKIGNISTVHSLTLLKGLNSTISSLFTTMGLSCLLRDNQMELDLDIEPSFFWTIIML